MKILVFGILLTISLSSFGQEESPIYSIVCNSENYSLWADGTKDESNNMIANYRIENYINDGAYVYVDNLEIKDSKLNISINIDGQPSKMSVVNAVKLDIDQTSNKVDLYYGTLKIDDKEESVICFVK